MGTTPRVMTSRSYSSPRLSVQLSVDTSLGSKQDSFGLNSNDIAQQTSILQLESPLALKQHMCVDCNPECTGNFMDNFDVATTPVFTSQLSAPTKESLVFDFNEVLGDL